MFTDLPSRMPFAHTASLVSVSMSDTIWEGDAIGCHTSAVQGQRRPAA